MIPRALSGHSSERYLELPARMCRFQNTRSVRDGNPANTVIAFTYGQEFAGTLGARFEFGVMLFTPPFACLGGCEGAKKNKLVGCLIDEMATRQTIFSFE